MKTYEETPRICFEQWKDEPTRNNIIKFSQWKFFDVYARSSSG